MTTMSKTPSSPVTRASHAFYLDANYPGVCYAVPVALAGWFEDWQSQEGSCMSRISRPNGEPLRVFEGNSEVWTWATVNWTACEVAPLATCSPASGGASPWGAE